MTIPVRGLLKTKWFVQNHSPNVFPEASERKFRDGAKQRLANKNFKFLKADPR